MLPPTRATSPTTAETMPGRSPPCTVSTQGVPSTGSSCSGGTSRTVTLSDPSALSGASAASIAAWSPSPALMSIIAK